MGGDSPGSTDVLGRKDFGLASDCASSAVCHPGWTLQGPWTKRKEFLLLLLICFKSSYYEDLTQLGTVVHASDPHTLGTGADF